MNIKRLTLTGMLMASALLPFTGNAKTVQLDSQMCYTDQDANGNSYTLRFFNNRESRYDPNGTYLGQFNNIELVEVTSSTALDVTIPDAVTFPDPNNNISQVTEAVTWIRSSRAFSYSGNWIECDLTENWTSIGDHPRTLIVPSSVTNIYPSSAIAYNMQARADGSVPQLENNSTRFIAIVPEAEKGNYKADSMWSSYYLYNTDEYTNPDATTAVYNVTPGNFVELIDNGVLLNGKTVHDVEIANIKITGTLDAKDMQAIPRFKNLLRLDLSEANAEIIYCNELHNLFKVDLPSTIKEIAERGFENDIFIIELSTPNVEKIGNYAFQNASSLRSANYPKAKEIGWEAFYNAKMLKSAEFASVTTINSNAFSCCNNLSTLSLCDELNIIPTRMCSECRSLLEFDFPSELKSVGYGAFQNSGLMRAVLPEGLQKIDNYAFQGNSIKYIQLPSSILYFGEEGGRMPNLKEAKCFMVAPTFDRYFADIHPQSVLYVAPFALKEFYISEGHYGFYEVRSFDDEDATVLNVVRDFNLETTKGLADNALVYVRNNVKFTVSSPANFGNIDFASQNSNNNGYSSMIIKSSVTCGDIDFHGMDITVAEGASLSASSINFNGHDLSLQEGTIGKISFKGNDLTLNKSLALNELKFDLKSRSYNWCDDYGDYHSGYTHPSVIAQENSTTKAIEHTIYPERERWAFIYAPYTETIEPVEPSTLWVVREYNGANRAANGGSNGSNWDNVTTTNADGTLQLTGGKGYILHYTDGDQSQGNYTDGIFKLKAGVDNSFLTASDQTINLTAHTSTDLHNQGWNLIGNPYPTYFMVNSNTVEFSQPITTWNGSNYEAYSLDDDNYLLSPFEAFFVQRVSDETFKFLHDGCGHYVDFSTTRQNAPRANATDRRLFNFYLDGAEKSDRTRIVLNENAMQGYDATCDASKFMSLDETAPQLFSHEGDVRMAINERPASEDTALLGAVIPADGQYTLSVERCDGTPVIVTDLTTGKTVDITDEPYAFNAKAGTYDKRFFVTFGAPSWVDPINGDRLMSIDGNELTMDASRGAAAVYTLDGRCVAAAASGTLNATLPQGIYVVKSGSETRKIAVK